MLQKKPKAQKTRQPVIKVGANWIKLPDFSLAPQLYNSIKVKNRIQHHIFIQHLNMFYEDITCVLRSFGQYPRLNGLLTLRYECSHESCERQYKIFQAVGNNFSVYRSNNRSNHIEGQKITRHVRGSQRVDVKSKLETMSAEEYLKFCEKNVDQRLIDDGNLQDCISYSSAAKMRSEVIQQKDFDKDDIIDLLMMKIHQDSSDKNHPDSSPNINSYIRRINLDPFSVTLFSDEQFNCLKLIKNSSLNEPVTVYFDATGSVARHGTKKIFYYAGVTPDTSIPLAANDHRKVLPLFENISGAHDTFNISLLLMEYKFEFQKKFPSMDWPITHAVSDFSYAILNAICLSWNSMKLIEYINCLHDWATSNSNQSLQRILTFIHICCCHLPKNFSNDVKENFPKLDGEQQTILKECFAGMFGILDITVLQHIWTQFSTLLLSKYVNDNVKTALANLAKIMVSEEKRPDREDDDDEEVEEYFPLDEKPPNSGDYTALYKNSKFFQQFKHLTFVESFAVEAGTQLNSFYSPQFAEMFLQKYIAILPLWTLFERNANSLAEGHFKDTKKRIINDRLLYGQPPLKCGRLVKLLGTRVDEVTRSIVMGIPRYRCTGQKRKSAEKMKTMAEKKRNTISSSSAVNPIKEQENVAVLASPSASILSLYKTIKSIKSSSEFATPATPVTPRTAEASTSLVDGIDNPNVTENWNRKSKRKFSHFLKRSFNKINTSSTQLSKILTKSSNLKKRNSNSIKKLKNGLVDHPPTYLAYEGRHDFVVAKNSVEKLKLYQSDFKTLMDGELSLSTVQYILPMILTQSGKLGIRFVVQSGSIRFSDLKNIFDSKILFLLNISENPSLAIINLQHKCFSYLNSADSDSEIDEIEFKEFYNFVELNNKKFGTKYEFNLKRLPYRLEKNPNSAVSTLHFIQQYIYKTKEQPFVAADYRLELQHRILRTSTDMRKTCIICGTLEDGDWVCCDYCDRWSHLTCIGKTAEEVKEDTVHYFCIICEANTSKDELKSLIENIESDLETINEES